MPSWKASRIVVSVCIVLCAGSAQAGLLKWIKKEALPTISGTRPIDIKPYVSLKSGSTQIKFGDDSAMIKVGGVTLQTGKLRYRLAQMGCLYATGGDVMTCAPDIIDREAEKIFTDMQKGIIPDSPPPPGPNVVGPVTPPKTGPASPSSCCITGNCKVLTFCDQPMTEVKLEPLSVSIGYNFDNSGSPNSLIQGPSAFIHTIAVARTVSPSNQAFVTIVGRADFAYMTGRKGGVICLFAADKSKYLKSKSGTYSDPYGLAAIGGSTVADSSPELMQIQLSIPWAELNIPDDINPYEPKFAQCHITVDDKVYGSTTWMPF